MNLTYTLHNFVQNEESYITRLVVNTSCQNVSLPNGEIEWPFWVEGVVVVGEGREVVALTVVVVVACLQELLRWGERDTANSFNFGVFRSSRAT